MRDALLIFLGRGGGFDGWLRLADGSVAARGTDVGEAPRGAPVVAVLPGQWVTLRWVELQAGLSPAQATAAARLLAAEVSAQPVAELHVAAGPERDGGRWIGLVPNAAMADAVAALAAEGLDPDRIVPEPLLLPVPEEGVACHGELYRGERDAFAAEPGLAELVLGGRAVAELDREDFEAGLGGALAEAPLDLRQGAFGRGKAWKVERGRIRRFGLIIAGILLATLAVQIADIARYNFAADAAEAEAERIAAAALPGRTGSSLKARLAELRGAGAGFSATAAALFEGVKATPNAELSALAFAPDGALRASVATDSPAAFAILRQRVEATGFVTEAGPERGGGGRRVAELRVRPR